MINTCPFEILNLNPTYLIDSITIEDKAKSLLEKIHPDRFLKNSPEWDIANERVQHINASLCQLKDPIIRAKTLLDKCFIAHDETYSNQPHIMFEIMELNEKLISTNSKDEIILFINQLDSKIKDLSIDFQLAFEKKEASILTDLYQYLSYYVKLKSDSQNKLKLLNKDIFQS